MTNIEEFWKQVWEKEAPSDYSIQNDKSLNPALTLEEHNRYIEEAAEEEKPPSSGGWLIKMEDPLLKHPLFRGAIRKLLPGKKYCHHYCGGYSGCTSTDWVTWEEVPKEVGYIPAFDIRELLKVAVRDGISCRIPSCTWSLFEEWTPPTLVEAELREKELVLICPSSGMSSIGRVIGKGGRNIKKIQEALLFLKVRAVTYSLRGTLV